MTDRWHDYVESGIADAGNLLAAAFDDWQYMMPVFGRVRAAYPPGSRILEIGCGAGLHASLLASWGYRVTAGDNDPRIVELAKATVATLGQEVEVLELDALALPSELSGFDLAFSLGLVEHFDRAVTVELLRAQGKAAANVMAVIPTKHTEHSHGISDERIYGLRAFERLFVDAGLDVSKAFAFGNLPTRWSHWMRRVLPPDVYALAQRWFGYGMNLCVFARAPREADAEPSSSS